MRYKSELSRKAAIVGIGQTEFSKDSGRSELRLAVEAVKAALDDAGLEPRDVEGYATFTMDNNPGVEINRSIGGGDLKFFGRTHYGGGAACATVFQAAMAVAAGVADVVVCYRAMNERSMQRFGAGVQDRPPLPTTESAHFGWYAPFGLLTPASWVAMLSTSTAFWFPPTFQARPLFISMSASVIWPLLVKYVVVVSPSVAEPYVQSAPPSQITRFCPSLPTAAPLDGLLKLPR